MDSIVNYDAKTILDEMIANIEDDIGEKLYPGDERRMFAEAIVNSLVSLFASANDSIQQSFLVNARGDVLDYHGLNHGLERIEAEKSKVLLKFSAVYPEELQTINIPAGTIVSDSACHIFKTDISTVLTKQNPSVNVIATAELEGYEYNNIDIGNINIVITNFDGKVEVTNLNVSYGGADDEDDEDFRDRIMSSFFANAAGTEDYYSSLLRNKFSDVLFVKAMRDRLVEKVLTIPENTESVAFCINDSQVEQHLYSKGNNLEKIYVKYKKAEDTQWSDGTATISDIDNSVAIFDRPHSITGELEIKFTKCISNVVSLFLLKKNEWIFSEEELNIIENYINSANVRLVSDYISIFNVTEQVSENIGLILYVSASSDYQEIYNNVNERIKEYFDECRNSIGIAPKINDLKSIAISNGASDIVLKDDEINEIVETAQYNCSYSLEMSITNG